MKQIRFLYYILLQLIIINSYGKSEPSKMSKSIDSTILEIVSDKQNLIKFYYNNFYLERPIVNEISSNKSFIVDTNFPILMVVSDSIPNRATPYAIFHGDFTVNNFLIYPNEKIEVSKDRNGFTRMISKDSIRTNELNFFVSMEKDLGLFEGFGADLIPLRFSAMERLNSVNDLYKKRVSFFENYRKKHTLSSKFTNYIETIFYFKRFAQLISPYYSLYESTLKKEEKLIDSKLEEWMRFNEDNYYIIEYRSVIQQYLHFLAKKGDRKTDVYNLITLADEKLKGNTREVALFDLILVAIRNGNTDIDNILTKYMEYASDGFMKDYVIKSFKPQIMAKSVGVGNDIMNSRLVSNKDFNEHTWAEILNTDENKIVYVDFWASWCTPCRAEMPDSKQLRDEYASKGIKFVYVSTDENLTSWNKGIRDVGITEALNFQLPDGLKSAIGQKFKIATIPRYMIFGKDGKLINPNAQRPSDPKIRKVFDELLKK